jgi:transcriptional regulator with XRE-family HTH domain
MTANAPGKKTSPGAEPIGNGKPGSPTQGFLLPTRPRALPPHRSFVCTDHKDATSPHRWEPEMTDDALFGPELRKQRMAMNLSLTELAKQVHYSKGHLSKIETGLRQPTAALARLCDEVLGANGTLSRLAKPAPRPATTMPDSEGESDEGRSSYSDEQWIMRMDGNGSVWFQPVNRRQALASGAVSLLALRAGARPAARPAEQEAALNSFTTMFGQLRLLGQRTSPGLMLPTLVAQTHTLQHLATTSTGQTRARAFVLAARYAEYTGWMTQEAGEDRAALWWTDRAVQLAAAGGDEELAAYSLVRRALVALYAGDGAQTAALAEQAQRHRGASERVRGLAAQRQAQGFALLGEAGRSAAALDRAHDLLDRAAAEAASPTALGSATLTNPVALSSAWCLHDLGRPAEAAQIFERELGAIALARPRFRARWATRQALAYATSGEVDRACALTGELLTDIVSADSATIRWDLRSLARTLSRWLSHPPVRELFPALANAIQVTGHHLA